MKQLTQTLRGSYSVRAALIGFLILVLLVPLAMVDGVIRDRRSMNDVARQDIMRSWGQAQILGGPFLVLPYTQVTLSQYGERLEKAGELRILPETARLEVTLEPQTLHRGIYDIPVYSARLTIEGEFAPPDTGGLGIDSVEFAWDRAHVALAISDAKAIRNSPQFVSGDSRARFESAGTQHSRLPPQIIARLTRYAEPAARETAMPFAVELELSGTESLQFIAMAESTEVGVQSNWASPSFIGAHLPEQREVTSAGFSARWRISNLGRSLPSRWTSGDSQVGHTPLNLFGVALFMPVSLYHVTLRATKYGILFVGLTFVGYFLFEVMGGLRLHPLQYLLVGFANTLFYLLLLSLAEHLGFGFAYVLSAFASTGLITGYSAAVLRTRRRAALMFGILALLYAFLYLTLKAESYAMLAGAVGLWAVLGGIMYVTRNVDWYQRQAPTD